MGSSKRIYIVDDDVAVRTSLTFFLGTAGFLARPSSGGAAFLADLGTLRPGCVLLDMRMPDLDGVDVIRALGERIASFPVIVMTGHGDIETAVRVMKLGASDFLEKPFAEEAMLETIDRILDALDAGLAARDEASFARARIEALTPREHDVLTGLYAGLSNKVIAHRLNLSVRTVEMHRASMMDHLAVRTLSDALRLAFVGGIAVAAGARPPGVVAQASH